MRRFREASEGSRGFTLVEMIITALVSGMLMVVVSRLFLGSFSGWIYNYSTLVAQQKARIVRDNLIKYGRQAQASTVNISRLNGNVPHRSMLTFTDIHGKNWAFYQLQNAVHVGTWTGSSSAPVVSTPTANIVIPNKVDRMTFFYPNLKDLRNINFALTLNWVLLADNKMKPVSIHMVGDIEIRDP